MFTFMWLLCALLLFIHVYCCWTDDCGTSSYLEMVPKDESDLWRSTFVFSTWCHASEGLCVWRCALKTHPQVCLKLAKMMSAGLSEAHNAKTTSCGIPWAVYGRRKEVKLESEKTPKGLRVFWQISERRRFSDRRRCTKRWDRIIFWKWICMIYPWISTCNEKLC